MHVLASCWHGSAALSIFCGHAALYDRLWQLRFDLGQYVNAFTCNSLLDDPASKLAQLQADGELASVLPTTNEYKLRGAGAVTVGHPIGRTGLPLTGACVVTFRVRRDSSIVFLKVRGRPRMPFTSIA